MFRYLKAAMVVVFLLFAAFFWAGKTPACRETVDPFSLKNKDSASSRFLAFSDPANQILKFTKK